MLDIIKVFLKRVCSCIVLKIIFKWKADFDGTFYEIPKIPPLKESKISQRRLNQKDKSDIDI